MNKIIIKLFILKGINIMMMKNQRRINTIEYGENKLF